MLANTDPAGFGLRVTESGSAGVAIDAAGAVLAGLQAAAADRRADCRAPAAGPCRQ